MFKGKGSPLDRRNHRGWKLIEQVLKRVEKVNEKIIRESIVIDDMQFRFMPGRGTTDTIFIVRQLQEQFLDQDNNLYFSFNDIEKISIE